MAKQVSPGVLALRKVVDDVYADAREAKKQGKLVGWSSSKFPCELAEAFDLNVMYPENQAAGIAAQRDGEIMCQAAEDLGFDNDICGYARISLAYAAGKRASRKFDPETLEFIIDPKSGKPLKDENGNVTGTLPYVAYGYTTAYPRDAYMGLFISELHFYARSWTQDGDETKTPRITAMTVVLTVAKRDADNQIVPLCTQKAIVQLPGEPVILYEPGTWDGKASSES